MFKPDKHDIYGSREGDDVRLVIDHAYCADWTKMGSARLTDWQVFHETEKREIEEYRRLHAKYGGSVL